MVTWHEKIDDGAAKWTYHDRPCIITEIGVEDGKVAFLKALVDGEEIVCGKNADGAFPDVSFEAVTH